MSDNTNEIKFHPFLHTVLAISIADVYPNLYQRIQQLTQKPIINGSTVDDLFVFIDTKEDIDFWNLVSMGEFKELKHEFPEFFNDDYIFTKDYPVHFTKQQLNDQLDVYNCVCCFVLIPPQKGIMDGFQITLEHCRGEKFRIKSTHPQFNMVLNFSDENIALREFNSRLNRHIETGGTIHKMGDFDVPN